jgi:aquaporin Z
MNPGTTLTFFLLGKVRPWDAVFYVCAQFIGALAGVRFTSAVLRGLVRHEAINYAATLPGALGFKAAWVGEFVISFVMMGMVLFSTNHAPTAPYTGLFAGALVAAFIVIEAPISGMSMNPARSLGSAIPARAFRGLWIYFTAPPLAMLCAAGLYTAPTGPGCVYCAKLNHQRSGPCIFNCTIDQMPGRNPTPIHAGGIEGR